VTRLSDQQTQPARPSEMKRGSSRGMRKRLLTAAQYYALGLRPEKFIAHSKTSRLMDAMVTKSRRLGSC
jgi:hypothetical protein